MQKLELQKIGHNGKRFGHFKIADKRPVTMESLPCCGNSVAASREYGSKLASKNTSHLHHFVSMIPLRGAHVSDHQLWLWQEEESKASEEVAVQLGLMQCQQNDGNFACKRCPRGHLSISITHSMVRTSLRQSNRA